MHTPPAYDTRCQQHHPHQEQKRKRRRGRFKRFVRGYLMFVGSLTTLYVLIQLLVLLFVEIAKWMPSQPNL